MEFVVRSSHGGWIVGFSPIASAGPVMYYCGDHEELGGIKASTRLADAVPVSTFEQAEEIMRRWHYTMMDPLSSEPVSDDSGIKHAQ